MTPREDLESLIRRYVVLGPVTTKGFHQVKCQVCNDYKVRGGFKFDGEAVGYSCFNCGAKGRYDPHSDPTGRHSISNHMKDILMAFGVPEDEIRKSVSYNFFKPQDTAAEPQPTGQEKKSTLEFPYKEAPLPEGSVKISTDDSPWCEVAREYLKGRGLDPNAMDFYVTENEKHACRVIIPYIFRNRIVYWQGRSMDPAVEPRYKNPTVDKDNIFFNMDELYRYTDEPLFVTEGPLDSLSIGRQAVATLGSSLSEFQLRELKKAASRRKVIFVIDKNRNGYKLGTSILDEGEENFYVAVFPDNIEDANDALGKLGKLFIATHLVTTAAKGFQGKLLLEMKCSKKKK